jgi:hypothetical protein
VKVAAGSGRANDIIKLPGGDRIHVKVRDAIVTR